MLIHHRKRLDYPHLSFSGLFLLDCGHDGNRYKSRSESGEAAETDSTGWWLNFNH